MGDVERINFKLDNKLGPTVWAVLPADRIAQKIKWALYKYYTTADNEVAYFHIKRVFCQKCRTQHHHSTCNSFAHTTNEEERTEVPMYL